jgi:hypothetical protein
MRPDMRRFIQIVVIPVLHKGLLGMFHYVLTWEKTLFNKIHIMPCAVSA